MPRKTKGRKQTKEKECSPKNTKIKATGVSIPKSTVKKYNLRLGKKNQRIDEAYDADSEWDAFSQNAPKEAKIPLAEKDVETEDVICETAIDVEMEENQPQSDKNQVLADNRRTYKTYLLKTFINKENLTPPETHSTPATNLGKKADDSLFGFNMLDSPLPFSPVVSQPIETSGILLPSPSKSPNKSDSNAGSMSSFSPLKRKIGFGFYDVPIEIPKKKQKRKPKSGAKKNAKKGENNLDALRREFQETEMHELLIE